MNRWGFIYSLGDPSAERQQDTIGTPNCELVCVGIASADDLASAARLLIEAGVELIELCGAFAGPGLATVIEEVEGKVPVGAVFYGGEAATGLHQLFG